MADERTVRERISDAAGGRNIRPDAIDAAADAAEKSTIVNKYLETIVGRNDFPDEYADILFQIESAESRDSVDNKSIECILQADADFDTLKNALISAADENIGPVQTELVMNAYMQSIASGIDAERAGGYAADLFRCMRCGFTDLFSEADGSCRYDREQAEAVAYVCDSMYGLAFIKESEYSENTGRDLPENYLRSRLYDAMRYAGGFDTDLTFSQIRGIGECVTDLFQGITWEDWDGRITPRQAETLKNVADIIKNHNSSLEVYQAVVDNGLYTDDMTPAEIWNKSKHEVISREISQSDQVKDRDDPISGLWHICTDCYYLSMDDIDVITDAAEMRIDENPIPTENGTDYPTINCIADMVIEGVPPKDIVEYIDLIGADSSRLEALYSMQKAGMPKDVTRACVMQGLDYRQCNEIIAARDNGVQDKALMSLCADIPPAELCKARLELQNGARENLSDKVADLQKTVRMNDSIKKSEKAAVKSEQEH